MLYYLAISCIETLHGLNGNVNVSTNASAGYGNSSIFPHLVYIFVGTWGTLISKLNDYVPL